MRRVPTLALLAAAALALAGCFVIGDSRQPIDTLAVSAPQRTAEPPLVIVLPGFGTDAQEMRERGVAATVHASWPEADVLLTSATFAYYRDGRLVGRLHEEIVGRARRQGYRRIWLAGASMGGMGALMYEREHPGELAGLLLFAPFLGNNELLRELRAAGGARAWNPGPLPAEMNGDNYQRQVWKMVKEWSGQPALAGRVWLACGTEDSLIEAARLLAQELPEGRFVEYPGGHTWSAWLAAAQTVLPRVRAKAQAQPP